MLYLLKNYLATVLVFLLAKVLFTLCNAAGHEVAWTDFPTILWHGLSLDLSTSLYLFLLPFLATVVAVWVRLPRWAFRIYYTFIAITLALAFVADTSIYSFWGYKLDASYLQYLEQPEGITQSVSIAYLLLLLLIWILVATIIFWLFDRNTIHSPATSKIAGKVKETLVYITCIPLIVIGIRGGIGDSTTNTGQVYYSQNQFLNHAAINPVFNFLYSISHKLDALEQYRFFTDEECDLLTNSVYTTESIDSDTLLNTLRPNILIILLESAGEQFAEAMPRLQELKKEGIDFSRCYANSWRTDRGTVCTLSGYPSFPSISVMKIPEKSRNLPSIALSLKQEDYQTEYLYGGDINFTNMRSYLIATGWQKVNDIKDFPLSEQRTSRWGVRDEITFRTLYQRITQQALSDTQDSAPHLWGFSTLSSHEPWDVPTHTHDDEVLNAFAYLDNCLAMFIDSLRNTPVWDNLLIILTADHGINYQDVTPYTPLRKNHIPMIWIGGAVKEPKKIDVICNQSDLAATLLAQLRLPHDGFTFSRDVFSKTYTHPTAVHNYSNIQWITDSTGHLFYDFDAQQVIIDSTTNSERLLRLDKAILQQTSRNLKEL